MVERLRNELLNLFCELIKHISTSSLRFMQTGRIVRHACFATAINLGESGLVNKVLLVGGYRYSATV